MVFNATFNNISVISWWSVLLVEETRLPRENQWPVASHGQTLSHNQCCNEYISPWTRFEITTYNSSKMVLKWHLAKINVKRSLTKMIMEWSIAKMIVEWPIAKMFEKLLYMRNKKKKILIYQYRRLCMIGNICGRGISFFFFFLQKYNNWNINVYLFIIILKHERIFEITKI